MTTPSSHSLSPSPSPLCFQALPMPLIPSVLPQFPSLKLSAAPCTAALRDLLTTNEHIVQQTALEQAAHKAAAAQRFHDLRQQAATQMVSEFVMTTKVRLSIAGIHQVCRALALYLMLKNSLAYTAHRKVF